MDHEPSPQPRLLYLLSFWPRKFHSAASERIFCHWRDFQKAGYRVCLAADGPLPEELLAHGQDEAAREAVDFPPFLRLKTNDPDGVSILRDLNPTVVVFDKYTTEEKYSWQVFQGAPLAGRILDTVDLHWLRKGRELLGGPTKNTDEIPRNFENFNPCLSQDQDHLDQIIQASGEVFLREMASILRSDLTLVVSDVERDLLTSWPFIDPEQIVLQTLAQPVCFKIPEDPNEDGKRRDFYFVGHYQHPPNRDSINWLKTRLWPQIRKKFTDETSPFDSPDLPRLHIYSAGMTVEQQKSLHHPASGFWVHGPTEKIPFENMRVNLAPLRSGAGIKGKIAEGWSWGIPVVTTPVGSEGMGLSHNIEDFGQTNPFPTQKPFGGIIATSEELFVQGAHTLYCQEDLWKRCQAMGQKILGTKFSADKNSEILLQATEDLLNDFPLWRRKHLLSSLLFHQSLRSTEYFSRWIQLKTQKIQT